MLFLVFFRFPLSLKLNENGHFGQISHRIQSGEESIFLKRLLTLQANVFRTLIFAKLLFNAENSVDTEISSKNLSICKQKISKCMNSIFRELLEKAQTTWIWFFCKMFEKAQKAWVSSFSSSKNLKKHEFHFSKAKISPKTWILLFAYLKKLKTHEIGFCKLKEAQGTRIWFFCKLEKAKTLENEKKSSKH